MSPRIGLGGNAEVKHHSRLTPITEQSFQHEVWSGQEAAEADRNFHSRPQRALVLDRSKLNADQLMDFKG